jgi:hypothetical protein
LAREVSRHQARFARQGARGRCELREAPCSLVCRPGAAGVDDAITPASPGLSERLRSRGQGARGRPAQARCRGAETLASLREQACRRCSPGCGEG